MATTSATTSSPIQPRREMHFGLTGLAVMGQNLVRNIASRGFPIAVHNRTTEKTDTFMKEHGGEGHIVAGRGVEEFVGALQRPRAVMIMVKAGSPVDDVIGELLPSLEPGDLVIDGGNSDWTDTARRLDELARHDILYLGTGVSGGEEGALHGPSLMPGGTRAAYDLVEPVFTRIAAQVGGTPCCTYIGDGGAGHYVKMVHNGIEYADMQLIAESYDLLHSGLGLDNDALHEVFSEWNEGELDSFLIQITAEVFARKDDEGDGYLIDTVLDTAGQKGTGRHTAQSALELGAPLTAITEAVFARSLSALKDDRVAASNVLPGPGDTGASQLTKDDVRDALFASKIVAYAQGFDQLQRASDEFGWNLDLGTLATIWRGGCIIRARFLDRIKEVYESAPPKNLALAPYFTEQLETAQAGWRRTVAEAIRTGIPTPAYSSSLAWYDGYRRARLPANLIQAQRDLFGAHTYERVDREGTFHSDWSTCG
jgi:6-phosphogluconate dehydrogenase